MGGNDSHEHDMKTEIKWSGRFWQNGKETEMSFNHMIMDQDGKIQGNGNDEFGKFDLTGVAANSGHVEIIKKYVGAHQVFYDGQMNEKGLIIGTWATEAGAEGSFELKVEETKPQNGSAKDSGESIPLNFDLCMRGDNVFGAGFDKTGAFSVSGQYKQNNGTMNFTKYYYGSHYIKYTGKREGDKSTHVIKGEWVNPGVAWDEFELTME